MAEHNNDQDNPHLGESFDDFLDEQGILDEVTQAACEQVKSFREAHTEEVASSISSNQQKTKSPE